MIIDTHCHIYLEEFDSDRQNVIDAAVAEGVEKIILPNIDFSSINKMMEVKNRNHEIFELALGLHPTSVKADYKQDLEQIFENFDSNKYVGIGEVGIDLYWDTTFLKQQKDVFDFQIEIAKKHDLPVIIHSRNSFDEIIDVLKPHIGSEIRGVFHCFPGDYLQAKKVIDFGFHIGIGGVLTYKKSNMPDVVTRVPLESILLETDAPYLSPVPMRGKRNEPSFLKHIALSMAQITGNTYDQICTITTKNAKSLFKL
jgi:TatD DNase family protein